MKFLKESFASLSKFEWALWLGSLALITLSFALSPARDALTFVGSLIGATALIFVSKGNVLGQILVVVFSVFYGIVSFASRYYGEMITYLGMSAPIAAASVVTWLKNPYGGRRTEVSVNVIGKKEYLLLAALSAAVTAAFYFILRALNTGELAVSTVSVLTSFLASYLTFRRSEYYALAYAANDVVLIALWVLASLRAAENLPLVACFVVFLANDLYGFAQWSRARKRQSAARKETPPLS